MIEDGNGLDGLLHHAAHEVPKAFPGVALVSAAGFFSLPWQQLSYFAGFVLIVVQLSYSVWKWRSESHRADTPKPTVPPSNR